MKLLVGAVLLAAAAQAHDAVRHDLRYASAVAPTGSVTIALPEAIQAPASLQAPALDAVRHDLRYASAVARPGTALLEVLQL